MYRYFIGALIALLIAAGAGWKLYEQEHAREAQAQTEDRNRIDSLTAQVADLQQQNAQLNVALAKVQAEQQRLVVENDMLNNTLAQARLTGKIPNKLPYPPK